jgi:hypothetical protein
VGAWPKDVAIVRITRIMVYTGAVVDSVRITYLLTNNQTKTVDHGGQGGKVALDVSLDGSFHFVLKDSDLLTQLELQLIKRSLLSMVAGSRILLSTDRESMCPTLFA